MLLKVHNWTKFIYMQWNNKIVYKSEKVIYYQKTPKKQTTDVFICKQPNYTESKMKNKYKLVTSLLEM